jgi:hypothetical protein
MTLSLEQVLQILLSFFIKLGGQSTLYNLIEVSLNREILVSKGQRKNVGDLGVGLVDLKLEEFLEAV